MADDLNADPLTGLEETPEEVAVANTLVSRLSVVVFLEWLGAGAVLPLLPIYLRQHGATTGFVGLTMSAFFLAGLVSQFPAGRAADRTGKRPVLLAGLALYAMSSAAFLLPINTVWFLVLRFLQGGAAGAVEVAALALVSATIPLARRGRAVSRIFSAQLAGTAIGPILGSIVGVSHMGILFLTTALLCCVAAVPVITSSSIKAHDIRLDHHEPLLKIVASRALVGAVLAGAALGVGVGVYESTWTLLMSSKGASAFQIGLSWTIFSIPYVVLVRAGGWMADHMDRRVLALSGLFASLVFLCLYPFIPSVTLLLVLPGIEAIGFSMALPAIQGLLTQGRQPQELGRVQGIFATSQTAMIALTAAISGALFGLGHAIPYVASGVVMALFLVGVVIAWAPISGRAVVPQIQDGS